MSLANKRWPSRFPLSGDNPGGGFDTLWLNMKVWSFDKQSLFARQTGGIQTTDEIDELAFLAPMSFAENINHNWEEHQNVVSRAYDAFKTITGHAKEAATVVDVVGNQGSNTDGVSKAVVDTPLVYKGSNRREITFDIILADQGDIWNDVYLPVSLLRAYSSAATKGQNVEIEFPYLFEISTVNGYGAIIPLVTIKWAALRSVQPTFHGPYRSGIPSKCDLTLTFVDMEPLYKESFSMSSNSKVTGSIKE